MTGNDIVDLELASQKKSWTNGRFLEKVFTIDEQALIAGAKSKGQMMWRLWSMKESAYKIHMRQTGESFFAPVKLNCNLETESRGEVEVFGNLYQTYSVIHSSFVYTTATALDTILLYNSCFEVASANYKTQHDECYLQARLAYCDLSGLALEGLEIVKSHLGVPSFHWNGHKQDAYLSITHHGRFGAFAIALPS